MTDKNIVVLISGSGSNLQAFIDSERAKTLGGNIVAVVSNKPAVLGLQRAESAGIDTHVVEHQNFDSREDFDRAMIEIIASYNPQLVILAGFMRILSSHFVETFKGRLLNVHPSLLPKYPGLHTHRRALENSDEFHGSSVHFVTEELDGGPVIAQARLKLDHAMDESTVMKDVQTLEHRLYPQVAQWFLQGRLNMENDGIYFDKRLLKQPIILD